MANNRPFISLTSDFGVQSQGVGLMEGTILAICPSANVVHLMHGLPPFDLIAAARTLEQVQFLPIGAHVCVCDPGVGTSRKALVLKVNRGDYLIGPDNGILIPASTLLGGIVQANELTNEKYMRTPVSPIFHGRDIFAPAAAHISNGVSLSEFGHVLDSNNLVPASYVEADIINNVAYCQVIQVNRFGSLHINILHDAWDKSGFSDADEVVVLLKNSVSIGMSVGRTFADVQQGEPIILKDDYGRVEIAINMGSFANNYSVEVGDHLVIKY